MSKQDQTNILIADFARMPKRVKAVKQLEASAKALGVKLVRKPVHLDDKWIAWGKAQAI